MPSPSIKTVIIPAAGLGTRLLPATKVTAKELLPVYDRVVLDFAIDEAVDLGAERIVIVISTAKVAIQAYLADRGQRGQGRVLQRLQDGPVPKSSTSFRTSPLGLGTRCALLQGCHASWSVCRAFAGRHRDGSELSCRNGVALYRRSHDRCHAGQTRRGPAIRHLPLGRAAEGQLPAGVRHGRETERQARHLRPLLRSAATSLIR